MRMIPRSVVIITKSGSPEAAPLGREAAAWLEKRGVAVHIFKHENDSTELLALDGLLQPVLALVLGGDGTFISVARRTLGTGIPVLGLNLGRVGFLAELTPDTWIEAFEIMLDSGLCLRPRMAMSFDVIRDKAVIRTGSVVNDLVVSRGAMARLVTLDLAFGEERVGSLRADGLIISTPSGSTAYCASAGGPVVHPDVAAFSVAPICPFLNNFRPLVIPGDMGISISVAEGKGTIALTEDGQAMTELAEGDVLRVARSASDLLVGGCERASYFQKLKDKGFITER